MLLTLNEKGAPADRLVPCVKSFLVNPAWLTLLG